LFFAYSVGTDGSSAGGGSGVAVSTDGVSVTGSIQASPSSFKTCGSTQVGGFGVGSGVVGGVTVGV
jgi:hypothetical protein